MYFCSHIVLDVLTAVSPVDGRYRGKTEKLANYFSEFALIQYRVRVEIEYFISLCELPLPQLADFDKTLFKKLRDIYSFTLFILSVIVSSVINGRTPS